MLSSSLSEGFVAEGFLTRVKVVAEPHEAERYRRLFDELEASEGREKAQIGLLDRHFDQPFIMELATRPNVLDSVEALLGPNIPSCSRPTSFANTGRIQKICSLASGCYVLGIRASEGTYRMVCVVDDSDIENGCMRVIPGSHAAGIREHGKADAAGNLLSINQEVPVTETEAASAVDLELHAGEASIHDGMANHCSMPNRSHRRRCGLTLRYVPSYVKPATANSTGKRWKAILVRGVDEYNHFGKT